MFKCNLDLFIIHSNVKIDSKLVLQVDGKEERVQTIQL